MARLRDIFNRSATKHGIDRDQDISDLLPGGSDTEVIFGTTPGYDLAPGVVQSDPQGGLTISGSRAFTTGGLVKPAGMANDDFYVELADLVIKPQDSGSPMFVVTFDVTANQFGWTTLNAFNNDPDPARITIVTFNPGLLPVPDPAHEVVIGLSGGFNFGLVL